MIQINIEYCIKWNYEPEFDRVSKIIKTKIDNVSITSNLKLPRTGAFEVSVNDKIAYSKFNTGEFPTESEIYSWFI